LIRLVDGLCFAANEDGDGVLMQHDELLVRALLQAAHFFATSRDETIDPDAALYEIDRIAECLQAMSSEAQAEFVRLLERMADKERKPAFAAFLRTFASDNGLV
jgi:sugar diacid utilization regulator